MRTIVSQQIGGQASRPRPAVLKVLCVVAVVWCVCGGVLWHGLSQASAHVAPAVKENNRYLKLTLFGDHARLAVVLYFGEIPGQKVRQAMDSDHDGTISDEEANRFAQDWAQRVKDGTDVTVDGAPVALEWDSVDVGMSNRKTIDGAFSIDLVSTVCVSHSSADSVRRIELRERFDLPEPGETEILPEESPGTEITRLELAGETSPTLLWNGAGGPLKAGLVLEWKGPSETSAVCEGRTSSGDLPRQQSMLRRLLPMLLGGIAALMVIGFVLLRRRKNSRQRAG